MHLLFAAYPQGTTVGGLQVQLQISNATLSHHLEKLRVEELVTVQRDSRFLWYSANVETTETLLEFLYNGCELRYTASSQEQAYQALELESDFISDQEGFMFENFGIRAKSFLVACLSELRYPLALNGLLKRQFNLFFWRRTSRAACSISTLVQSNFWLGC